ncbi:hypothetical protein HDU93_003141, partial [Gonapodya sp. JEL0774]
EKDDSIRAVAHDEPELYGPGEMDRDLVSLWTDCTLPPNCDLAKELDKVGMKALMAYVPEGQDEAGAGDGAGWGGSGGTADSRNPQLDSTTTDRTEGQMDGTGNERGCDVA